MKIIAFILLLPTLAFGQAFTPRRPFVPALSSSSTFTGPGSIANLLAWYSPTNTYQLSGALSSTNQNVGLWKNQWTNDFHLTNYYTGGGLYPTNRANGPNGSNYVRLDFDSGGFSCDPLTNNIRSGSNFCIFSVLEAFTTTTFGTSTKMLFLSQLNGDPLLRHVPPSSAFQISVYTGPATIPLNKWMTVSVESTPTTLYIYTNNALYISGGYNLHGALTNLSLGNVGAGVGGFEEILVYDKAFTTTERSNLFWYYTNKYNLTP